MRRLQSLAAVAMVALSACTARFISEHDPILDARTTELSKRVESFLLKMEAQAGGPAGTYAQNREFYDDVRAELFTSRVRAESQPHSELLVQQYSLLGDNFEHLAGLHRSAGDKGLEPRLLGPARDALRVQFRALTQLHTALRRGSNG